MVWGSGPSCIQSTQGPLRNQDPLECLTQSVHCTIYIVHPMPNKMISEPDINVIFTVSLQLVNTGQKVFLEISRFQNYGDWLALDPPRTEMSLNYE